MRIASDLASRASQANRGRDLARVVKKRVTMTQPQPQPPSSEASSSRVMLTFVGALLSGSLLLLRVCNAGGGGERVGGGCSDSSECAGSAVCIQSGVLPLGTCMDTCRNDADCSPEDRCRRVDGESISVCANRPSLQFGDRCSSPDQCEGDVCLVSMQSLGFSGYCSSRCTWMTECPEGALCYDGSCVRVEWMRAPSNGSQPGSNDPLDPLAGLDPQSQPADPLDEIAPSASSGLPNGATPADAPASASAP